MRVQLSQDAIVNDLAVRMAARRTTAIGRRAGNQWLVLAIEGQPDCGSTQSDRSQSVIKSHPIAA